ncbi:peroxiredoxin [Candidatus Gromoviella agglomerans]|uniref:peroxiredoxin n=1 Tax=Candidatus Gromoviella agglomerans TaxID=2806609 RepID=UPI001E5BCF55|nr:peroxiredoxin [Candidatus Gromoviella agglomerans]UFX98383.1 Peroxiredoxin family protein [Candidatus Gromoviella agglomerans]
MFVKSIAPYFKASAVMPDNSINDSFSLNEYAETFKVVLFFYPLDFTFVCPTEIVEFDRNISEFEKRDVKVVGVSVDSVYSHLAWKNTPHEAGGIGNIQYPLVSDLSKSISRSYGVIFEGEIALRGTFIIDKNSIIRHMHVNDLGIGRNISEIIRLIDAIDLNDKYGEVCPATWNKDKAGMKPNHAGVVKYFSDNNA